MATVLKKVVGASALGAISIVELLHLQQASATPVTFTGSTYQNPRGGSVQVAITVDGSSGVYRITSISTPLQPTGQNASYASYAIPTLTSEALAAQSAAISGVTGASEISAAWKSSLSSAIAAAAAGGETIGQASVAPTPTPTPSAGTPTPGSGTPTPGATSQPPVSTGSQGTIFTPVSTVIPKTIGTPPVYYPLNLPPYSGSAGASTVNFSSYLASISNVLSILSSISGDRTSTAVTNARNALLALQSKIQSDANQPAASTSGIDNYIANANTQMAFVIAQANQQMADYFAKVQSASNQMYVDAQASAAAVSASPAPTVTVTVTATPTPPPVLIKPGGVIKKTFICAKTVAGKTTKQTIKALVVKCPTGFVLVKK